MRSLYSHANRKLILTLLSSLPFKTNLKDSQKLLNSVELMQKHQDCIGSYYSSNVDMPIDGIISSKWLDAVVEVSALPNNRSIKRIN